MAFNLIMLLVCADGFVAAHTPIRTVHTSLSLSLPPPSQQQCRHRHRCHGDATTMHASPAIAGFCSNNSFSRRSSMLARRHHHQEHHRRRRADRSSSSLSSHDGLHTSGRLLGNPTIARYNNNILSSERKGSSTSLLLAMEAVVPTDNNMHDDSDNSNFTQYNWTSQTIAIAVPSLAGMMTDPLLSLADTLFVGMLGSTVVMKGIGISGGGSATVASSSSSSVPLAALGACTSIFHLCFHCFRATTSSTSSLVTAALVRDKKASMKAKMEGGEYDVDQGSINLVQQLPQQNEAILIAQTSIQQSIIMGSFISTFLLVFGPQCLHAMGISPHGGQPHLYSSAMTYLNYRSIAAPAVVMLSASEGIFRGYGDVITPWKVSCLVSLLNLILDPFCMFGGGGKGVIHGLGMGIKGAAVATALSQVGGALVYGRILFERGMLGGKKLVEEAKQGDLKRQQRGIAATILRANAAMMAKQGSLLLAWAYATSRATRMGHTIVASHQMALSIWLVVALFLDGAGVAAQVLMAREWEGYKLAREVDGSNESKAKSTEGGNLSAIRSLSGYMIKLSLIQGLVGSLAMLLLRRLSPSFIFTSDPTVRQNLLTLLPHVAYQMTLVSVTLVTEALAIGGGRFRWLAGGTTASAIIAMIKLRGSKDLVGIWSGVSIL
jgi:Na+-driven multidrug efflux pump